MLLGISAPYALHAFHSGATLFRTVISSFWPKTLWEGLHQFISTNNGLFREINNSVATIVSF